MKKKEKEEDDIKICRDKINNLLREYNCELLSADEWHTVLIRDLDTHQTLGKLN